jgi:hypothetical protein
MNIRSIALAGALFALLVPTIALAQEGGPPPEVRAQFEKLRDQTKTDALNDLSADHRSKVQAILSQVQSGEVDPQDAASQIDSILTPDESKKVLGEEQKLRDAMRQQMSNSGFGGGFGGRMGGGSRMGGGANRKPDAGRFLARLAAPPPQP